MRTPTMNGIIYENAALSPIVFERQLVIWSLSAVHFDADIAVIPATIVNNLDIEPIVLLFDSILYIGANTPKRIEKNVRL